MGFLKTLPRERWAECTAGKWTFLHAAAAGPNKEAIFALLQSGLLDVNASDRCGFTPVDVAVVYRQLPALELLLAAGGVLCGYNRHKLKHLLFAPKRQPCVRLLVANGLRLATLDQAKTGPIPAELWEFEREVLQCRLACVALLALHKRGRNLMSTVGCKYMAREIALAVYATRATFL